MVKNAFLIGALVMLAACGDPLADMPRLSDVDVAETDPTARAALPSADEVAREGFFGTAAAEGSSETAPRAQPSGGGFFARLTGAAPSGPAEAASDVADVSYGTVLPFGQMARVCDAKRQPMGSKVEQASSSGYRLYDSNPNSTGQRTFYITGFDDGCPRQLTAAQVLLGAPSFYEQLHYGPGGEFLAYGETDKAYESVKRQVCGAGKGKPCGRKIGQLEKRTVFVSSYQRLNDNATWSEQLIHDGVVQASALKSNG